MSPVQCFMLVNDANLVDTHYTVHLARPLVPNLVEVSGIHVGKKEHPAQVCSYSGATCCLLNLSNGLCRSIMQTLL